MKMRNPGVHPEKPPPGPPAPKPVPPPGAVDSEARRDRKCTTDVAPTVNDIWSKVLHYAQIVSAKRAIDMKSVWNSADRIGARGQVSAAYGAFEKAEEQAKQVILSALADHPDSLRSNDDSLRTNAITDADVEAAIDELTKMAKGLQYELERGDVSDISEAESKVATSRTHLLRLIAAQKETARKEALEAVRGWCKHTMWQLTLRRDDHVYENVIRHIDAMLKGAADE